MRHLFTHSCVTGTALRGDVVEIRGDCGAGKTHIVYEAVVNCILPAKVGGEESQVIYFDLDAQLRCRRIFEMARFRLEDYVASAGAAAVDSMDTDAMLHGAMERIVVYRPRSSFQLLCTLHFIDDSLTCGTSYFPSTPKLIVVDTLLAFTFQDLMNEPDGWRVAYVCTQSDAPFGREPRNECNRDTSLRKFEQGASASQRMAAFGHSARRSRQMQRRTRRTYRQIQHGEVIVIINIIPAYSGSSFAPLRKSVRRICRVRLP